MGSRLQTARMHSADLATRGSSGFSFINRVSLGFPHPSSECMELACIPPPPSARCQNLSLWILVSPVTSQAVQASVAVRASCAWAASQAGLPQHGPGEPGVLVCPWNRRSLWEGSEISFEPLFCMRPKLHPPHFFLYPYPSIKKQNEHHRKCCSVHVAVLAGSGMRELSKANKVCWGKHLG